MTVLKIKVVMLLLRERVFSSATLIRGFDHDIIEPFLGLYFIPAVCIVKNKRL